MATVRKPETDLFKKEDSADVRWGTDNFAGIVLAAN
jgi:hypothetical protein